MFVSLNVCLFIEDSYIELALTLIRRYLQVYVLT